VHNISRIEIEGTKYKRIPLGSLSGNYLEVIKATDKDGTLLELAYDKKGNRIDAKKLFERSAKDYQKKYGKMHESLYEEIYVKKKEVLDVAIWLNIKDKDPVVADKGQQESREGSSEFNKYSRLK
jgi:hypothetical protein